MQSGLAQAGHPVCWVQAYWRYVAASAEATNAAGYPPKGWVRPFSATFYNGNRTVFPVRALL
jgi:hypothetical protein